MEDLNDDDLSEDAALQAYLYRSSEVAMKTAALALFDIFSAQSTPIPETFKQGEVNKIHNAVILEMHGDGAPNIIVSPGV